MSLQKLAARSMFSHFFGRSASASAGSSASAAALAERVIRAMKLRAFWRVCRCRTHDRGRCGNAAAGDDGQCERKLGPSLRSAGDRSRSRIPRKRSAGSCATPTGDLWQVRRWSPVPLSSGQTTRSRRPAKTAVLNSNRRVTRNRLSYVVAYKEGFAPASIFRPLGGATPAGDVALVLAKPVPFVGIVQGRDGRPIAGARARIRYMRGSGGKNDHNPVLENVLQGTPLEALFVAIADARGGFRFPAVPAPQGVVLNVSAEGMADLSTEVPGDYAAGFISGTEAKPARLTMEAGGAGDGQDRDQVAGRERCRD